MDLSDLKGLNLGDVGKSLQILAIVDGLESPKKYASVRDLCDRSRTDQDSWFLKLVAIDSIIDGYGVETIVEDGKAIADYVNMGDPWIPTVVYDREKDEFIAATQGDFYEEWQAENIIEVNCEDVAKYIHKVSHSKYIEWEEWNENDRSEYDSDEDFLEDAAIDIRLQIMEDGSWSLPYGISDYDQDHRGAWGSSSVGKCVSMKKAMEIAKDLIEQAADAADYNLTKTVRAYNDGN